MPQTEINLTYTLAFDEFVAGSKLGLRQNLPVFLMYVFARYLGTVAGLLLVALVVFSFFDGQRDAAWHLLPGCVLLLLLPLAYTWQWRASYNALRESPSSSPQMSFHADEVGFIRRLGDMGELSWRWAATKGVTVGKRVVLIAARKGAFIIIPRRVLSEEQIAILHSFQKGQGDRC